MFYEALADLYEEISFMLHLRHIEKDSCTSVSQYITNYFGTM